MIQDNNDRSTYLAKSQSNKTYADYFQRVETTIQQMRNNGQNPSREGVLRLLVGQDVLEKQEKASSVQAKAGKKRIAQQKSRPVSARQDVKASRRGKTLEERLEGVLI